MKKAFTMAEVLITLGIIGIVAAMTLPALTSNWRKKTVEARLKKFYSVSNQAIMLSEVRNGPKEYWTLCHENKENLSCEDWYNIYLKSFLNTIKVEHFKNNTSYDNTAAYFEDGSVMVIKEGYDIYFYPFAKDFDKDKFLSIDDDGKIRRPDSGKNFFSFSFRPNMSREWDAPHAGKGIEPYRALVCKWITDENGKKLVCNNITRDELINNSEYGCNESSPYKAYCTALIQENNWEIPDDYPFKF